MGRLTRVAKLTPATAGLLMVPYGLGTLIAMPIAGRLSDALGGRRLIWAGALITVVGFTLLIFTGPDASMLTFVSLALLLGLGLGAIGAPTVSSLPDPVIATVVIAVTATRINDSRDTLSVH